MTKSAAMRLLGGMLFLLLGGMYVTLGAAGAGGPGWSTANGALALVHFFIAGGILTDYEVPAP